MSAVKDYDSEEERLFSVIVAAWHREKYKKRHELGAGSRMKHTLADIGYLMFGLTEDRVHVVNQRVVAEMARSQRRKDRYAAAKAMRGIAALVLIFFYTACGTSYKAPPSTTKVATKVATAQRSVQHSQDVTKRIEATNLATTTNAATTAGHIAASLDAIGRHDYVTATQEDIAAQVSNATVLEELRQSNRDVQSLKQSLGESQSDLSGAQGDVTKLTADIGKMASNEAKYEAIAKEVNWGFRVGALLYFLKGLLAMGFWGILIIGALLIAALVIGGPIAGVAMKVIAWILSLIRKT